MRKIFKFDKVAYTSKRRVNLPTIEMKLTYKNNDTSKPILSRYLHCSSYEQYLFWFWSR